MNVASNEWQIKIEGHQFIMNKADRSLSKFATNPSNLHTLETTSHIMYTVIIWAKGSNVIYKYTNIFGGTKPEITNLKNKYILLRF